MAKQITIRNVSPGLARRLKAQAEAAGTSVNATILMLLEQALWVDERKQRLLDRYGTWTENDYQEFEQSLREQRTIDENLWK